MRSAWLLTAAGLVLGWPSGAADSPQIGSVEQHSEGACSPPIINNQGQVSISCPGVAPEALRYLESKLTHLEEADRTIRNLNELSDNLRKQADDWAQRYRELSARESRDDSEQAKQAHELIQHGEFATAEAILVALATKEEDDIARAAATQYDLGTLAMLRFDPPSALPHYERAFRYQPDNLTYTIAYATAAFGERQYLDAEKAINQALDAEKLSGNRGPADQRYAIANTLTLLGEVDMGLIRPAAAEKVLSQAMEIGRELVGSDPASDTYRQLLANAQAELGLLYINIGRPKEAETALKDALTSQRVLAKAFHPKAKGQLSIILMNLSTVYVQTNDYKKAESSAQEALQLASELSSTNLTLSRMLASSAEINLGAIYTNTLRFEEAEKLLNKALEIKKELALHAPGAYQADVAKILVDLSIVYEKTNRPTDAKKVLGDAIEIYRREELRNPDSFVAALLDALRRIATVDKKNGQPKEAEQALIEAENVVESQLSSDPIVYSLLLAKIKEDIWETRKLSSELKP